MTNKEKRNHYLTSKPNKDSIGILYKKNKSGQWKQLGYVSKYDNYTLNAIMELKDYKLEKLPNGD